MSIDSLRNQFLAFVVVTIFIIAQPEFSRAQESSEHSGFYVKLEGRYVMSAGDETPYSRGPGGINHEIGLNNDDGSTRFGIGYRMGKWDIGFHYSGLKITGDHVANGCGYYGPCAIYPNNLPLIGNPTPSLAVSAGLFDFISENADYHTTYHVMDFEAGYTFNLGQTEVRAIAGARFAQFYQNIDARGTVIVSTSPIVLFEFDTSRSVSNWGVGPLLGVEVNQRLGGKISLSGSIKGSVLFGDRDVDDGRTFLIRKKKLDIGDGSDTFRNAEGDLVFLMESSWATPVP